LIQQLNIKQFLDKATYLPLIDVRSPAEYERGHIPGAVNIPVFDNDERAEVGTMYKQVGRDKAILLGLEIVKPKLAGFVKKVKKHGPPPWAPAHGYRKNTRHVYFPVQQTYFDIDRGVYISLQGDKWEVSASIPLSLKGVDLKVAAKIELDFSGENPQSVFGEHKKKFPKTKK